MTVTIGGVALDNVIDFEFGESKEVSKPEYISELFKVDTNVWNKSCIEISYILYASNYIKNELKTQLKNHVLIDVYDDIYQINTANAFLTKMTSSWVGDKDWEHPWQITLIILIMEEIDDSSFDLEAGTKIFYEDFEDFNTNGWTIHNNDLSSCETAGSQANIAEGWIQYGTVAHWYMYFKPLEGTYSRRFKMSGTNTSGATTVTSTPTISGCIYYGDAPWLDVTVDGGGAIVHNDANYLSVAAYYDIVSKLDTLEGYADDCDAYHVSHATLHIRGRTSAYGNANSWNRLYVTLLSRNGDTCVNSSSMGYTPRFTVESGWEEITLDISSFYQNCHSFMISETCIEFGNVMPIYEKFYGALSSVWITFQCSESGSAYLEKDLVTRGTNYYNALTYDVRFFVYDSIDAYGWLLHGKGDDGTTVFVAWLDSSGYIHIDYYAGVGGSQTIKCDSIVDKIINWNRWNWLRIYYNCDYTAGAIQIWLNGTLIYDYTGATIDYDGIGLETVILGLMYAGYTSWWDTGTQDLFVDNIAIYEPYEEELTVAYSVDAKFGKLDTIFGYSIDVAYKKINTTLGSSIDVIISPAPLVPYWTNGSLGGVTTLELDAVDKKHGVDCLKITYADDDTHLMVLYHDYSSDQDFSVKDYISFWWYGSNTGQNIYIDFINEDYATYNNGYSYSFLDNFAGWQLIHVLRSTFTPFGTPTGWNHIKCVAIANSDVVQSAVWKLDYLTVDDGVDYTIIWDDGL
jgi:hypothetical protein